jgi:signal transduction histidine kinase
LSTGKSKCLKDTPTTTEAILPVTEVKPLVHAYFLMLSKALEQRVKSGKPILFVRRRKEIVIASIIIIIAVSYFLLFFQQNIAEQNIRDSLFLAHRNNQVGIIKGISEHVSSDLRLVTSILQGLSDSSYLQQGELYGDRVGNLMGERFNQINKISKIDGLFIADRNNIITYNKVSEGQRSFVNIDISFRDYVRETKSNLSPVFSNGFRGIDGTHKIALTFPIINRDSKEYIGMVGVEIPSVDFFARYGNVYNIDSTFLVAYDRNSNYISTPRTNFLGESLFSSEVQRFFNFNGIQNKYYRNVFDGQLLGGYAIYDFGAGERLNTGYPVSVDGKPKYFVFVITPTASVYSDINKTLSAERSKFFLLIAGITAAILILILFLVKLNSILNEQVKRRTKDLEESNKRLKTANEKLNIHDKMQIEFINITAHELRTPIQPILVLTEYIRNRTKDKEQIELLDVIIKNTKRLKNLAEEILDVTRIERGVLSLNKERFCLNELVVDTVKELQSILDNNNKIKFEYDIHNNDPVLIYADKSRIRQVLSNLISNSIKFVPNEGIISLKVEMRKSDDGNNSKGIVVVSIKDTGIGIDAAIMPKLFTKFASKSFQGTGLGLYISKSIVESHGGKIWAENNKDGKGATFSFSLPIV